MLRKIDLTNEELEGYYIVAELDPCPDYRLFLGSSLSQTTPSELVAIKLLTNVPAQQEEDILQTLSHLQELQHPHIFPIQSIGMYKQIPYLISSSINIPTLDHHLQKNYEGHPMPLEPAFSILAQIGQALQYAHQHKIIHGNIQPQNVLINLEEEVFVTDFSLHTLFSSRKREETRPLEISTYWAPEQLVGHISTKSDQYALGCIAYEMVTGCKAFTIPSVKYPGKSFKTKTLIEPRRFNLALPPSIENAILKAMSKDPDRRYPDIEAFLSALGIPPVLQDANHGKRETNLLLPVTPVPVIHAITLARMDEEIQEETPLPSTLDESVQTPGEFVVARSQASFLPALLPTSKKKLFPHLWQRVTHVRKRTLILSLIALLLVIGSLGIGSLISTKMPGKSVYTATTTTLPFPSHTSPTKTGLGTPSYTPGSSPFPQEINPHPTPTPILTFLPTQPLALTPGATSSSHPTPNPTSAQSSGPQPTPTSVQGSGPGPRPKPTKVPTPAPQPTPTTVPTPTPVPVSTPVQVSLNSFFNNKGIGSRPGMANFDGSGFSYAAQLLPSGGQITIQGVPFQFPGNSPQTNDNFIPSGETVLFTPGNYQQGYLLASSSWGPVSGVFTIHYTDGSTDQTTLTAPDWCSGHSNALSTPYRYNSIGPANNITSIYALSIMIDPTRTADALLLPTGFYGPHHNGHLHIFAFTLQP